MSVIHVPGTCPPMRFKDKSRVCIRSNVPNSTGSCPRSSLLDRSKWRIVSRKFANATGTVPVNRLLPSFTTASPGEHRTRHRAGTSPSSALYPKSRWYKPSAPLYVTSGSPSFDSHRFKASSSSSTRPAPGQGTRPVSLFRDALNDSIVREYISSSSTLPSRRLPSSLTPRSFGSLPASPGGKSPARPCDEQNTTSSI